MWSLDLSKLDGWVCTKENSGGVEAAFKPPSESSWESDDDDEDSD